MKKKTAPNAEAKIMSNYREIIRSLGENPSREGLLDTPKRFTKAMQYLTSGYQRSVKEVVGKGIFKAEASEIVIVRDIEFYSLCEHHTLPFFGKAHVAYLPTKKIIGLSKIPRIVDLFSQRLQVQERLTSQIAQAIDELLEPAGVAVIIEASHFCMMMRGVEKQGSSTITSKMLGEFREDPKTRAELMGLLQGLGKHR
jgi:GTP cyclohydrolase I